MPDHTAIQYPTVVPTSDARLAYFRIFDSGLGNLYQLVSAATLQSIGPSHQSREAVLAYALKVVAEYDSAKG